MKHAKEYLDKVRGEEVIEIEETIIVQSSSDPFKKYTLTKVDGNWLCECVGFQIRGKCSHSREASKNDK
ncbi:MAG: hypothetical protein ISS01_03215 [Nanoarchaeota archaeon]|nr:hypothetical protein [Nanoarchaeota archaeon]